MDLKTVYRKMIYLVLGLSMPLVVLLTSTLYFAWNANYFMEAFQGTPTAKVLGISQEDLARVVQGLTAYMAGEEPQLNLTVTIEGQPTLFYNERELEHMVDVRNLMALGQRVSILLGIADVLLLGVLWWHGSRYFWRGLLAGCIGAIVLALFLGVVALMDFEKAFVRFHELFFTNDLWLLDPEKDRLIRMLPENVFYQITLHIVKMSGAIIAYLTVLTVAVLKWGNLGEETDENSI